MNNSMKSKAHSTSDQLMLSPEKGTYLLFLINTSNIEISIGALGLVAFLEGVYVYVGSALGLGGIERRVRRHLSLTKKTFWHIDYFSKQAGVSIIAITEIISNQKLECEISNKLSQHSLSRTRKFGASDCSCEGHLLFFGKILIEELWKKIRNSIFPYSMNFHLVD